MLFDIIEKVRLDRSFWQKSDCHNIVEIFSSRKLGRRKGSWVGYTAVFWFVSVVSPNPRGEFLHAVVQGKLRTLRRSPVSHLGRNLPALDIRTVVELFSYIIWCEGSQFRRGRSTAEWWWERRRCVVLMETWTVCLIGRWKWADVCTVHGQYCTGPHRVGWMYGMWVWTLNHLFFF